ncbi:MAG TPA: hypothetical protein VM864_14050 [Pyrinomonadaceae bacterium]|nr:hypothetical protein [Pyrinomonadaceae bacterium]
MADENRETINRFDPAAHVPSEIRRCRVCGVRKLIEVGFYRAKDCRGGRRHECKKCHNRWRAAWARSRYVPKTGRRYVTKSDLNKRETKPSTGPAAQPQS